MIKYKYLPIIRNRDGKGHILTYSVTMPSGLKMEFNTLKEAKTMAVIVEEYTYIPTKKEKSWNDILSRVGRGTVQTGKL